MVSSLANNGGPSPHTSGIFADMTVDGPEIGTLVLIVDRAKNLPNRKTMGKQNPYCAARLGKEARKTETDRRGGQTPRWDQELRFTVHESPDYNNLKISIFSEDKRTDLIGEAWVSLAEVVIPGGGKSDLWQGLNYKGKYAGELRIELTYYDERPRIPVPESAAATDDIRQSSGSGSSRVKRRPLPSNPSSRHVTPDTIPQPGPAARAKHGPRDFAGPPRANSMPPEVLNHQPPHEGFSAPTHGHSRSSSNVPTQQALFSHYASDSDHYQELMTYDDGAYDQNPFPDFLPELPPSNRQRGVVPLQQPVVAWPTQSTIHRPRPQSHVGLPHSQSAPVVPMVHAHSHSFDDSYQLRTDYPEPIPDLEYQHQQLTVRSRRNGAQPDWQDEHVDPYTHRHEFVEEEEDMRPPPPPMHSNSAPMVPQLAPTDQYSASSPVSIHGSTPPNVRHRSVPNASPLQMIERTYSAPQQTSPRIQASPGMSVDGYSPSPPGHRPQEALPLSLTPGHSPTSYTRPPQLPRPTPHRLSIAESYTTPPRPHPLSQEVPRSRSPQPPSPHDFPASSPYYANNSPYSQDYRGHEASPLSKSQAVSPQPAQQPPPINSANRPHSSYSIQFPVRAFESADGNPLSTSQSTGRTAHTSGHTTPLRKPVSAQPSPPNSAGGIPFSPDSFDVHNPNAKASMIAHGASPHSPYQIKPGSEAHPREERNGPIVGWHGQEIDPSDHLPIDSWAPEPEKKTPTKTYGLGRDRDFGPRSAHSTPGSRNISKDTVISVRPTMPPQPESSSPRNRLQKKSGYARSPIEPLREHQNYNSGSVPDPYAQQEYGRGFYAQGNEQGSSPHCSPFGSYPPSPAEALSQEISNIDIGGGGGRRSRHGSVPAPTAYVPVRSHWDRNTFY